MTAETSTLRGDEFVRRTSSCTSELETDQSCSCWHYMRLAGSLLHNLLYRLGSEAMDALSASKERLRAAARRMFRHYDDVFPAQDELEPSLGGGSLSRPHRGVPPPSDHHLPPPRGNLSAVGLPAEPWFHKMDRRQADVALKEKGENGCFMIRPSHTTNPYTLSLIYDGQAYHIGVRKRLDGQFALGSEKYNEQKFASVEALVDNYRREHLVLYSHGDRTGCTRLTGTPSRNPANH